MYLGLEDANKIYKLMSFGLDNSPTLQEKKCADVQIDSKQSEHVPVVASVSDGPPTMKASMDVNSVSEVCIASVTFSDSNDSM